MEVPETVVTPLQQQYLKKHRQHHLFVAICRLLGFLLILTVWELSSDFQLIDSFIFSSPLKVVRTIGTMWTDGSLIRHTAITLGETAASFILVILFSFLTATLLWFFHSLFRNSGTMAGHLKQSPKIRPGSTSHRMAGCQHADHHRGGHVRGHLRKHHQHVYRFL